MKKTAKKKLALYAGILTITSRKKRSQAKIQRQIDTKRRRKKTVSVHFLLFCTAQRVPSQTKRSAPERNTRVCVV